MNFFYKTNEIRLKENKCTVPPLKLSDTLMKPPGPVVCLSSLMIPAASTPAPPLLPGHCSSENYFTL